MHRERQRNRERQKERERERGGERAPEKEREKERDRETFPERWHAEMSELYVMTFGLSPASFMRISMPRAVSHCRVLSHVDITCKG